MWQFYKQLRRNNYPMVDHTTVDVYTSSRWPSAEHASRRLPDAHAPRPAVSLIATVKNEGQNIGPWFRSLLAQTRGPDEIVIVDGGSSDGTFEMLKDLAGGSAIPVKIERVPGANIARGRNLAIERAQGPVIVCTDAGCLIPPDWLANITGPFAVDLTLEVAAGYYQAVQNSELQRIMAAYFVQQVTAVDPQSFLPSTRSMAFQKAVWRRVGEFPEWLTLTAEDTLFDLALKRQTTRWAFVPEASVQWHMKGTLTELFRQVRAYASGDGEAGLFPEAYWSRIRMWAGFGAAAAMALAAVISAIVTKSGPVALAALLPIVWIIRRLAQITLRPEPAVSPWHSAKLYVMSAAVICTITLAMATGFILGVWEREKRMGPGETMTTQNLADWS